MSAPKQDAVRRLAKRARFVSLGQLPPVSSASPRPGPRLVSPVTVNGDRVRRPPAPTSAKDESIVVHRPAFVPLQKDCREPAVSALSSLLEDLLHRMAGSSHELDLRPESRSHASDPCPEQGQLSPTHTEGTCE